MSTITISISDDRLLELQQAATRLGISPEDLVRISIEDLLGQPEEAFRQAVDHALRKNAELYRRLA